MGESPGTLSEVVQDEGGEDDETPRRANRLLAEVAHIRVERFGPCYGEEDRTEDQDA